MKYAFHSDTMVSFPIGEINEVFLKRRVINQILIAYLCIRARMQMQPGAIDESFSYLATWFWSFKI